MLDNSEMKKQKREFITHTGIYNDKRLSVISTGIGTDNIDIVINELDALVNIDLEKRTVKEEKTSLNFIRIGTCGALHKNIPINSAIVSDFGLGFDNLLRFYKCQWDLDEKAMYDSIKHHLQYHLAYTPFYLFGGSKILSDLFPADQFFHGTTITAPGFFGPQGRSLRLELAYPGLIDALASYEFLGQKILNFEMETSAIFGLSKMLGHRATTVDLVLANRATKEASIDYNEHMKGLAQKVLDIVSVLE